MIDELFISQTRCVHKKQMNPEGETIKNWLFGADNRVEVYCGRKKQWAVNGQIPVHYVTRQHFRKRWHEYDSICERKMETYPWSVHLLPF